ncbi:MAG TPA: hypothetical protein VJN69_03335 [Candidatus Acidoferrales bacterium]|nr:hypothetical protein [Candidatus Acidoferrales bacterium]
MRRLISLYVLIGCVAIVFPGCQSAPQASPKAPIQITKERVNFAMRTFNPSAPPTEMPPLKPGEVAVCDSNFISNAALRGENHRSDGTHATLTITGAKITLQANITIWTPIGASERVIEHEQGHRQISEYYYRTADKVAEQIAETYVGRQVPITGADLDSEATVALRELAKEFTNEYSDQLNSDPAQELFDTMTDHSRNETPVSDAITAAIKDAEITAPHPVADAGN